MQCAYDFHPYHPMNSGSEECDNCPPGSYCPPGEGLQPCPAGYYCLGGSMEGILPCPPGTYSPQPGLGQVEQCLLCPAGQPILTHTHLLLPSEGRGEGGFGVFDSLSTWHSLFSCPGNSEVSELQHNNTGKNTRQEQNMSYKSKP